MTMKWIFLLAVLGLSTATASAQTDNANPWNRGTTLTVFGGGATASPNTTGALGTALGWELTHRVEIEGAGAWLSKRRGAHAFAADLKGLVNLTRPGPAVPYVGGGVGMYRGIFDTPMAAMPTFYRRRMANEDASRQTSYTDPTAVVSGGLHIFVARHFSIRPEATIRFVADRGRSYRVGTLTVGGVYHVEEHVAAAGRRLR
jgi:hypothetical protein